MTIIPTGGRCKQSKSSCALAETSTLVCLWYCGVDSKQETGSKQQHSYKSKKGVEVIIYVRLSIRYEVKVLHTLYQTTSQGPSIEVSVNEKRLQFIAQNSGI